MTVTMLMFVINYSDITINSTIVTATTSTE